MTKQDIKGFKRTIAIDKFHCRQCNRILPDSYCCGINITEKDDRGYCYGICKSCIQLPPYTNIVSNRLIDNEVLKKLSVTNYKCEKCGGSFSFSDMVIIDTVGKKGLCRACSNKH